MRIQSATPMHNGGWFHRDASAARSLPPLPPPKPSINATQLMWDILDSDFSDSVSRLARSLGVSEESLHGIYCGWSKAHHAFAFPMRDEYGNIIGIRLRNEAGKKWAVRGSRSGLFYPMEWGNSSTAIIVEGPTDVAAALTIGLFAIGRPACLGCEDILARLLKRIGIRQAIIVSDSDSPGLRGANKLDQILNVAHCMMVLPFKDMREFVNNGGTQTVFSTLLSGMIWHNPQVPDYNALE